MAHASDHGQPPRLTIRIDSIGIRDSLLWSSRRSKLDANRVVNQGSETHVEIVDSAGALTNPELVRRQIIKLRLTVFIFRQTQHCTLIIHQQSLMGGINL